MSDITNYENLANAIILQAAKDYRVVLKCLTVNPKDKESIADKSAIERFFRSQWFSALTSVDGEMLMRSLIKEADA